MASGAVCLSIIGAMLPLGPVFVMPGRQTPCFFTHTRTRLYVVAICAFSRCSETLDRLYECSGVEHGAGVRDRARDPDISRAATAKPEFLRRRRDHSRCCLQSSFFEFRRGETTGQIKVAGRVTGSRASGNALALRETIHDEASGTESRRAGHTEPAKAATRMRCSSQ